MAQKFEGDLLTASAVAMESGVPQLTIRRWSREGLIECRTDSANRRIYGRDAIDQAQKLRDRKTFRLPKKQGRDA